ncbi:MAG: hypothetical protein QOJ12_940 [Thermoleophilales bacterium]|nr:hypothetical protein [Thermoleophilales bacterium]
MKFHDPELAKANRHLLEPLVAELRAFEWAEVPCAVCGEATDLSEPFEKWDIAMRTCNRCDHLFVTPRMPDEAMPVLYGSRYWDDYTRAIGSPTIKERLPFDHANGLGKLRRDVLPFRTSGRLIDVGGSSGGLVRQALDLGFDAVGLEPAPEICELARSVHGVTMYCGALRDQGFADASFDIVTLHDVLEHMFEPVDELREIRRILAPGGLFVCETPTSSSLNFADLGADGWSTVSPLEHVHLFNEQNAARVLEETGFRIVDLYCPHEDNWIAIAEAPA